MAEIWSYIASQASAMVATRLLTRIEMSCRSLLGFPGSGTARDPFAEGLRVMFEGNYAIYYMVSETELVIVRVLHGARDAAALAERGGFV